METISLCMIVRNEEQFLEQCLISVKNLVNEIIIIDTGSTDRTKEIASRFTDKIFNFAWCDDFSAARNESLKHATKDWILVLDADEIIFQKDQDLIKRSIEDKNISAYFLNQRNYTNNNLVFNFVYGFSDPSSKGYLGWFDSWIIRLFRNNPLIKFEGEVHERVDDSIEKISGKKAIIPLIIHHYAENKELSLKEQKRKLYEKLGKLKLANNSGSAAAHYQMGVVYKEAGNFLLAEEEFKKALELEPHLVTPWLDLALVQQKQGHFDKAINNYLYLLKNKSDSPEAYFGLGFCYFKKEDLSRSALNFEKVIKLNPYFLEAYINLGGIYEKQNKLDEALKVLALALPLSHNNPRTYYNLGVLQEKKLNLILALRCYRRALELGYIKEGLKERIEKIEKLLRFPPDTQ